MKKVISMVLLVVILLSVDFISYASAAIPFEKQTGQGEAIVIVHPLNDNASVRLYNSNIIFPDAKPLFDKDGEIKAPVRILAEALGADSVQWDATSKKVTVKNSDTTIVIKIGDNLASVNGKTVDMKAAAFIKNSRTYVPVSWFAETWGYTATFDGKNRIIDIQ